MDRNRKVNLMLGIFIACLILSNVIGAKITSFSLPNFLAIPLNLIFFPVVWLLKSFLLSIGGREIPLQFFNTIQVSVGILTVPVMFLITDIIEEVYGKKKVKEFIFAGVASMIFVIIIVSIAVFLPSAERSLDPVAFNSIFKVTIRMTIASILAFILAQTHDMWSFEFWKKKTQGKHLWIRNNLSTMVSQLIDSTVFMFVAFFKSAPMWDAVFVISLIVPYYIFKILFAVLDTPFAYLGVWWVKKKD